jgi:hypothetical protein
MIPAMNLIDCVRNGNIESRRREGAIGGSR